MFDDLGNAKGFGNSEAATLRYDRDGRLAARAGFDHRLYRLGLHPHAREFIAISADGVLHAYDDDLCLLWRIPTLRRAADPGTLLPLRHM
jgi:hypothetical protein